MVQTGHGLCRQMKRSDFLSQGAKLNSTHLQIPIFNSKLWCANPVKVASKPNRCKNHIHIQTKWLQYACNDNKSSAHLITPPSPPLPSSPSSCIVCNGPAYASHHKAYTEKHSSGVLLSDTKIYSPPPPLLLYKIYLLQCQSGHR